MTHLFAVLSHVLKTLSFHFYISFCLICALSDDLPCVFLSNFFLHLPFFHCPPLFLHLFSNLFSTSSFLSFLLDLLPSFLTTLLSKACSTRTWFPATSPSFSSVSVSDWPTDEAASPQRRAKQRSAKALKYFKNNQLCNQRGKSNSQLKKCLYEQKD